jgi:hypothetical protein
MHVIGSQVLLARSWDPLDKKNEANQIHDSGSSRPQTTRMHLFFWKKNNQKVWHHDRPSRPPHAAKPRVEWQCGTILQLSPRVPQFPRRLVSWRLHPPPSSLSPDLLWLQFDATLLREFTYGECSCTSATCSSLDLGLSGTGSTFDVLGRASVGLSMLARRWRQRLRMQMCVGGQVAMCMWPERRNEKQGSWQIIGMLIARSIAHGLLCAESGQTQQLRRQHYSNGYSIGAPA